MNVLFVCLGNICRSPIAEALLKKKYATNGIEAEVSSAGFEPELINKSPEDKVIQAGKDFGINIDSSASIFRKKDFDTYDKIYAMDQKNYLDIVELSRSKGDVDKVDLIMNTIEPGKNKILQDPFQSGEMNCDNVLKILDKATDVILSEALNKRSKE